MNVFIVYLIYFDWREDIHVRETYCDHMKVYIALQVESMNDIPGWNSEKKKVQSEQATLAM